MHATDVLTSEHRVIEQVLACLEKINERALAEGRLDAASAQEAIDFFRVFADGCHHRKEERHLFPTLEAAGLVREHGPTGVMLAEHESGREHIAAMARVTDAASRGDREALRSFADHACGYINLLRAHIAKEDLCLFPMANHLLEGEAERGLLASFEKVERDDTEAGAHEHYLAIADRLADRFGVPHVIAAHGHDASCGCSHRASA